jgi:hypothetical protein
LKTIKNDGEKDRDKLPNWERKEKLFSSNFEKTLVGTLIIFGSK